MRLLADLEAADISAAFVMIHKLQLLLQTREYSLQIFEFGPVKTHFVADRNASVRASRNRWP
ncbi:hypothetical protein D7M11_03410 [Paenibacillus ginsengarvi]|uniref:Uncharacterized protein n=1 Tax=Paenibacillus ginsengarvi TaxID=400777 RepID=A0A3B0CL04_9BACL|nr:hypothetical protein D7M11_03410 [Paenibacillus ginsengarvi]